MKVSFLVSRNIKIGGLKMKKEAIGFCKNWNEKGFGFIQIVEGEDKGKTVFLHYSKMYSFYHKALFNNEMVTVAYEEGEKGLVAVDCWSNVYGYIKGTSFREFTDTICDVEFNYNKLCVPKESMYKYRHIKNIQEYKEQVSNILANKKKSNKVVKKNSSKKSKTNKSFFPILIISLILVGAFFWIKDFTNDLIKNFSNDKIVVCKDRLVSKELGYLYNKNENAFVNKKEGLIFTVYYCSDYYK
jgi:cold shock CspA family protein